MTTRSTVTFRVKQYINGQPWILVEELQGDLDLNGFWGLDLPHGTSFERAAGIAEYLNSNIEAVAHTLPERP